MSQEFRIQNHVLVKYHGEQEHCAVPEGVLEIGEMAFMNCHTLKSIALPKGLHTVRRAAFISCVHLEQVDFPDTLTAIEEDAFRNCDRFRVVILPPHLEKLGQRAFEECRFLEKIVFPDRIKQIEEGTVSGCEHLTTVVLPKNLREIQSDAFSYCIHLREIHCPDSLERIGRCAFQHDSALTGFSAPENLREIGRDAFQDCKNMEFFEIPKNLTNLEPGTFRQCGKLRTFRNLGNPNFSVQGEYWINRNGTAILAAPGARGKITIPEGVTEIGEDAFANCDLKQVTFPATVTAIRQDAFSECVGLQKLIFAENPSPKKLPLRQACVEKGAFYKCIELKEVELPEGFRQLAPRSFYECFHLETVTLPKSMSRADFSAFSVCFCLNTVILKGPRMLLEIKDRPDSKIVLIAPEIPLKKVKSAWIRRRMVRGYCRALQEGPAFSPERAEEYRRYIRRIRKNLIPDARKDFYLLRFLLQEDLVNPEEIPEFLTCPAVGDDIERKVLVMNAQSRCRADLNPEKEMQKQMDFAMFGKLSVTDGRKLWRWEKLPGGGICLLGYRGTGSKIEIPAQIGSEKVLKIGDYALSRMAPRLSSIQGEIRGEISSVTIPEGILDIGAEVFTACHHLKEIELPSSVRSVGAQAFRYCSALKKLVIPRKDVQLGEYVTAGCTGVTLYAPAGGAAEHYAKNSFVQFQPLE